MSLGAANGFSQLFEVREKDPHMPGLGAIIMVALLGLAFSFIGFRQKDKKQWTAVSGLAISGADLLAIVIVLSFNLI